TQGRYQLRPTLPFAPGMDAAGVVRSAPPGSGFEAGQRVAVLAAYGCWQDVITADPSWTLPLPDDMGFEAGAAAPLNYLTSLFALVRRGQAQPGEVLLVHGAAGGAGAAAIQVGRACIPSGSRKRGYHDKVRGEWASSSLATPSTSTPLWARYVQRRTAKGRISQRLKA